MEQERGEREKELYDLCNYSESIFHPLHPPPTVALFVLASQFSVVPFIAGC